MTVRGFSKKWALLLGMLVVMLGAQDVCYVSAEDVVEEVIEEEDGVADDDDEIVVEDGDDADEFDEYEGQWKHHPDVATTIHFPDHPDGKFPMGEDITTLIGFKNNGDELFNITGTIGHLKSPFDLDYYIQNMSFSPEGVPVNPGQQVTIEYIWKADGELEPLDYWMSHLVLYNTSDDRVYITHVFNETIQLVDTRSNFLVNLGSALSGIITIAGLAFAWSILYTKSGEKALKKYVTAPVKKPVIKSQEEVVDDWGITAYSQGGKKTAGAKKRKSKK